ncbi:MAG: PAS domain S-box protein [Caldisericia bacterium]|nr:PAS domain S-box protein [Caldisericia bacterium]
MKNCSEKNMNDRFVFLQDLYYFDAIVLNLNKDSKIVQFSSSPEKYSTETIQNFPNIFDKGVKDLLFCIKTAVKINSKLEQAIAISFRLNDSFFEALFFYSNQNFLKTFNKTQFLSDFYMECFFSIFKEKSIRKILSSSQNILMIKDSNFRYVYANVKCLEFFGLTLENILGKDDFQIASKTDAERIRKTDIKALENQDIYNCRREIHGNTYSVDKCKIFLNDNAEGIWIVARDISAEEIAKNLLRVEKKTLFTTLKSIGDAVITTDALGRITLMNKNAQELTDWLEIDAMDKSIDEVFKIIDEDGVAEKICPVSRVIQTKTPIDSNNNIILVSKTGKRNHISNLVSPIMDSEKNILGVVLVFHDVTKEYKTKRKLIESQKEYQNLFYNMLSGFGLHKIITNKSGMPIDYQFIKVNDGFERHTGLKRAKIIGKNVTEVLPDIRKDSFNWIEKYGEVALQGKEMKIEQFSAAMQKWYNVYAFSPEYGYFATIIEDITSKKMIEIETIANQKRLESLVKILQYQTDDQDTIIKHALNEAISVSDSKIGYIFLYEHTSNKLVLAALSEGTLQECNIPSQKTVYDIGKTGLWCDLIRFKKSVTNNSFKASSNRKDVLSRRHVFVSRYLSIPLFSDDKVVAIVLVANKKSDYTKTDELQLELLMNSIWSVIERKKTKADLYQFEKKLALTLEASKIGSWNWDIEKDDTVFDNQFALIIGYTVQELYEKKLTSWKDFAHPDDIQLELDVFDKLSKKTISVFEVEERYRHKTKGWIWISKRGKFTAYNNNGKPIRMSGTIIDITKRKKAEIETQNQKNELQWLSIKQVEFLKCTTLEDVNNYSAISLCKKIPDSLIFVLNGYQDKDYMTLKSCKLEENCVQKRNIEKMCDSIVDTRVLVQYDKEILNTNKIQKMSPENLNDLKASLPKKFVRIVIDYFNIENSYRIKLLGKKGHLGTICILQKKHQLIKNKKTIESFVFKASLIFERILIENEEKETKKRLEQVAEQAKSIIWETDVSGEITYISPYVEKLLGYLPSDLIHVEKWSNMHLDEEKEVFESRLEDAFKNKTPFNDLFTELRTVNGESLYVSSSGVPITVNGKVTGFRGSDYDITTLKIIDNAKNEFINTVSHEMRTPLTVIKEAAGILSLGELSKEQKEVLRISNKNINRLSRIINDVLDYQKLKARKVELVYENIDLKKFLDEIIADHKPIAEKKGLILSSSFHTGDTRLLTDSDKLYEVIGNLLNNAIKYTSQGSIKIVVKDKIFTGNIVIQVIDTGIGIPKKELPKLFKAFSQTSGVRSRKTGSTGLGLAICKEIVELFGGSITVSSSVGVGTRFNIELPKSSIVKE